MVELQPKDILSIDLERFTRFALNDTQEGEDLIFMGRLFQIILACLMSEGIILSSLVSEGYM